MKQVIFKYKLEPGVTAITVRGLEWPLHVGTQVDEDRDENMYIWLRACPAKRESVRRFSVHPTGVEWNVEKNERYDHVGTVQMKTPLGEMVFHVFEIMTRSI